MPAQTRKQDEVTMEQLLDRWMPYIKWNTNRYKSMFRLDESYFEDLLQEASIAFIKTCRKFMPLYSTDLKPAMLGRCRLCMNYAMRSYIWRQFNEKNIHKRMRKDNVMTFSDMERLNIDGEVVNPLDFVGVYDDVSKVNVEKAMECLTNVEKRTFVLWTEGYNQTEIAKIIDRNQRTVSATMKRVHKKMRESLSAGTG